MTNEERINQLLEERQELVEALKKDPSDIVSLELLSKNTWRLIALAPTE